MPLSSSVSVCAIVPAFNEASRVCAVLDTLHASPSVGEIIVVDDGSTDGTEAAALAHLSHDAGKLRVLRHDPNRGKGAAMRTGAEATCADVLIFFDADLVGLTPALVENLLAPVIGGKADMALGVFRGGRGATTLAQILVPNISGQRAIRRDVFLAIPRLTEAGYGVELAITSYILAENLPMVRVVLTDVTHPMKEEKLGFFKGVSARLRMYRQMLPYMLKGHKRRVTETVRSRTAERDSRLPGK